MGIAIKHKESGLYAGKSEHVKYMLSAIPIVFKDRSEARRIAIQAFDMSQDEFELKETPHD